MEHALQFVDVGLRHGGVAVVHLIDYPASVEQCGNHIWRVQVVVHRFGATLAVVFEFSRCGVGGLEVAKSVPAVHHSLVSLFRRLESLVREVNGATVVGLKNKEANGHWGVGLVEAWVVAAEELGEGDEVAKRFTHLLTVDGNHIVVHPVAHHVGALRCHSLCNLTFVVREHEVHAAAVNVEMLAEVLASHGSTFAVPTRETVAPRRWPAHDVLRRCLFPEGEVGLVALFAHAVEFAAGIDDVVEVASRQHAVAVVLIVFFNIEIHAAVAFVGIAIVENFLHELLLLDDVASGVRFDAWWQHIELVHSRMVAVGIVLGYFHWFQLLKACLLFNLVVALIGIVLKVANVGDVTHIAHLVAQRLEVAEQHVECDGWARVTKMWVAINGWAAHIHTYRAFVQWHEVFLATSERIVDK